MTKKNAWNKVYEETEKTYKVKGEDGKWTTLFVDGNHDCHPRLADYPVKEWRIT